MNKLGLIIFDLDGTILDSMQLHATVFVEKLERLVAFGTVVFVLVGVQLLYNSSVLFCPANDGQKSIHQAFQLYILFPYEPEMKAVRSKFL